MDQRVRDDRRKPAGRMKSLRLALAISILVAMGFAFPLLRQFFTRSFTDGIFSWTDDAWAGPFLRTVYFAVASSTILVFIPFGFGLILRPRNSAPYFYAITLVPALLGSVCMGFAVKLVLMHSAFLRSLIDSRQSIPTWALMLTTQTLQFGPLFCYLFMLRMVSISHGLLGFGSASRLTFLEEVRDIYWPHCRNLAAVLALFALVLSLQEFSKFYLVLKASAGTGMELASHRLLRYYSFAAPLNPVGAGQHTLAMAAIFVIIGLVAVSIVVLLLLKSIDLTVSFGAKVLGGVALDRQYLRWPVAGMLLLSSAFPLLVMVPHVFPLRLPPSDMFWRSFFFTFLATALVTGLSITFGAAMRVGFKHKMKAFDTRSLPVFVALSLILVLPPIAIAFCGFHWISLVGQGLRSAPMVLLVWVIGQVCLSFPPVACFILSTHFAINTSEIDFQAVARTTGLETMRYSFWRRFGADYLLVGLFAFSFVWNEGTLSSVVSGLSRDVPSLAVRLLQRVDGRASSYNEAANLVVLTFVPVLLALLLWMKVCRRYSAITAHNADY